MNIEKLIADYKPSKESIDLIRKAKIAFLSGVSGVGKNTITEELLKKPDYKFIVSHTTRPPRKNNGRMEKNGKDYYFTDKKTIERMIKQGEFFEVKFVHGNIYGTSLNEIQKIYNENKIAISDIDVQGVEEYKKISSNVQAIFILPSSETEWKRRLRSRGDFSDEDFKKRLQTAKFEIDFAKKHGFFNFVVNDDLQTAVKEVNQIIKSNINN